MPGELKTPLMGEAALTLTDALGRTVQHATTKERSARLDVKALPEGIYTLRALLTTGKTITQQVIVKH